MKPFIVHLKTHKIMKQGKFFLELFSCKFDDQNWPSFSQVCYLMHMLRYTKWEDLSLTILPNVPIPLKQNFTSCALNLFTVTVWQCMSHCDNNLHLSVAVFPVYNEHRKWVRLKTSKYTVCMFKAYFVLHGRRKQYIKPSWTAQTIVLSHGYL